MGRSTCTAIACAFVAGTAHTARAELLSLSASRDAAIYESADGSAANGAGRYLFAGRNNQNLARRSLIHFELAGVVPDGAEITSARLILNLSQGSAGPAREVRLHRALTAWTTGASDPADPEGSGMEPSPGDATWIHASFAGADGGTLWQHAGGDFDATASASALTGATGLYTWSSNALLADVRAFLAGSSANLGWFLVGDESAAGTARRFDSADGSAFGGVTPRLEIEFTVVPAPGALGLLAGAALIGRRRR